jgi:hypothetical protein
MSKLLMSTYYVNLSEPCLGLFELDFPAPKTNERHRFLIVQVLRNDKIVEFRKDLGASKTFPHDQIRIPGGAKDEETGKFYIEHTVGELLNIAEQIRVQPMDKKELTGLDKIK